MTHALQVRLYQTSDLAPLLFLAQTLERDALSRGGHGESWASPILSTWLQDEVTWVLAEGPALIGFLILKRLAEDTQEVLALGVQPSRRGLGGASSLVRTAWAADAQICEWWLEVHESNVTAQRLYERVGFVRVGLRSGYYQDQGAALLYTLTR